MLKAVIIGSKENFKESLEETSFSSLIEENEKWNVPLLKKQGVQVHYTKAYIKDELKEEIRKTIPHYVLICDLDLEQRDDIQKKIDDQMHKLGWRPIVWEGELSIIYPLVLALGGAENKFAIYFPEEFEKVPEIKQRKKIISKMTAPFFYSSLFKINRDIEMSNSILKSKLIALCWALLISLEDKKPLILLIDDYEILKCLNYTLLNANLRKHQNFDILFILSGLLHAFEKNVDPFDFYDSSAHIYLNSKLIVYLSSDLSLRDSFSLDVARCAAEMSACSVF